MYKVLIFTPGGLGGAERMSVNVGKILPKEQFSVEYVVIGRLKTIYNIIPEGFPVDCIPVKNIYCFSTIRILWTIIRKNPDVVFVSQEAYNGRVILASKIARKPIVIRSSNMIGKYSPSLFRQVCFTYPKADLIIAQQEEMRTELINVLEVSPAKVITIHNFLDVKDIDILCSSTDPYGNDNEIRIVSVARINYNKAQDIAIKAMSIINRYLPSAVLYLVGPYNSQDKYYRQLLKIIEEYHLNGYVRFVGQEKNPYKWMKYSNCFILPSRVEGLPNALIEASYIGVPCVATRCLGIIDEIIVNGQNGYTVEIDDINGLAMSIIKAVTLKKSEMVYKPGTKEEWINAFNRVIR